MGKVDDFPKSDDEEALEAIASGDFDDLTKEEREEVYGNEQDRI